MVNKSLISSRISIKTFALFMLLPVLMLLLPSVGVAANLFDPSSDDASMKVLGALFGGLMPTAANNADPMLSAIKIFNSGVLIIGGILAAYTILAGTIGTAHDGEMLGKKFSSVWIPIRYSVGTALILPVIGGGYCVMQALVMWLVIQGVGLADQVWVSYMSNGVKAANTIVQPGTSDALNRIAINAFRSSMCTLAYAQLEKSSYSEMLGLTKYNYTRYKTDNGWSYGLNNGLTKRYANVCGTLSYPQKVKGLELNKIDSEDNSATPNTGLLGNIGEIFVPLNVSDINNAHINATDTLSTNIHKIAEDVFKLKEPLTKEQAEEFYKRIIEQANLYSKTVRDKVNTSQDLFSDIEKKSQSQGWLLAGAWFTRVIKTNELIFAAVNQVPGTSILNSVVENVAIKKEVARYFEYQNDILNVANKNYVDYAGNYQEVKDDDKQAISENEIFDTFSQAITEAINNFSIYELKNDLRHPVIKMNAIGNTLELIGGSLMGLIVGGSVLLAGAASIWPGAGSIISVGLTAIGWFAQLPLGALVTASIALKYFLPNLPYIIWIGCIVGWTLLVVEAVIAAPLWAVMHLHPNGDDLTGRGGNGYMLVLSLLLRPVLMIFGFIAAIVISGVIGEFINKTFFEVFMSSGGNLAGGVQLVGFPALFSLVSGTVLYCIVMYVFIRKCFGLIHMLPDQLLKWIGGGDQALGAFASEMASSSDRAQQIGAAGIGYVSNKVGNTVASRAGNTVKQIADRHKAASSEEGVEMDSRSLAGPQGGFLEMAANKIASRNYSQGPDGKFRNLQGTESFQLAQAKAKSEEANKELGSVLGSDIVKARSELSGRSSVDPYQMNNAQANNFNNIESAIDSQLMGAYRAGGEGPEGINAAQKLIYKLKEAKTQNFDAFSKNPVQFANQIGQQVQTETTLHRLSREGYSNAAMSFLSTVAGDGNGNINRGDVADVYLDKMNEVRSNYASSLKSSDPSLSNEEIKIKSTEHVNDSLALISKHPTKEQQIESFEAFRNKNKPI